MPDCHSQKLSGGSLRVGAEWRPPIERAVVVSARTLLRTTKTSRPEVVTRLGLRMRQSTVWKGDEGGRWRGGRESNDQFCGAAATPSTLAALQLLRPTGPPRPYRSRMGGPPRGRGRASPAQRRQESSSQCNNNQTKTAAAVLWINHH